MRRADVRVNGSARRGDVVLAARPAHSRAEAMVVLTPAAAIELARQLTKAASIADGTSSSIETQWLLTGFLPAGSVK